MEGERDLHMPLCDLLGCRYPILQAGMGGVARSELVAAVTEAGGYGFLGMVRETPDLIAREIDAVRARTDRPFGVNLIPAATDPSLLEAELSVCLKNKVHSLCFFWDVRADVIARAKAAGCCVLYQVGSVEDAVAAAQAGADAIIAQGVEAGGSSQSLSWRVSFDCVEGRGPALAEGGFEYQAMVDRRRRGKCR